MTHHSDSRMIRGAMSGLLILAAACGGGDSSGVAPDRSGRAEVLRFWDLINEATRHRTDGDLQGAVTDYLAALAIDPDHEDALYYLGQCYVTLGRRSDAREAFERLIRVNPESSRGQVALGVIHATPDEGAPFNPHLAASYFARAHEINAEETGPMLRLGEVLMVAGRDDEARGWFEATLRSNPRSVEAACLAGFLHWRRGDAAAARSYHGRALAAGRAEAPVAGVLGEGDRREQSTSRTPLPPLGRPMGKTIFGDLCSALPPEPAEPDEAYAPIAALTDRLAALVPADSSGR